MLSADNLRDDVLALPPGQSRILCPDCVKTRRNKSERTLSVHVDNDTFTWHCWHCEQAGKGHLFAAIRGQPVQARHNNYKTAPSRKPMISLSDLTDEAKDFLRGRNIDPDLAARMGVKSCMRYFREEGGELPALAFVYTDAEGEHAYKFRALKAKYFSSQGKQTVYWGQDHVEPGHPLVIVEGELDALALRAAGVANALSVPTGAPNPKSGVPGHGATEEAGALGHPADTIPNPAGDSRFSYVVQASKLYEDHQRVIIFCDNDGPGIALSEELARRIGRFRCYKVRPPADCKDANDVLVKHGPARLVELVEKAEPWPVAGLYDANHYGDKVLKLWSEGMGSGVTTGLSALDDLFSVVPGQVSVVTGTPGSGKSELVDQLAVNLVVNHGWPFCMASFENPPQFHLVKLIEKYVGAPFFKGPLPRIAEDAVAEHLVWANRNFCFIEAADGMPSTIDMILDRAKLAVMRLGIRGLVIDPYNYIERDKAESETEYVSDLMTKVRRFSVAHDVHTWIIAHPSKVGVTGEDGQRIPDGYSISGSAHWFNKADLGITVHRPDRHKLQTLVRLWKVRFKWVGRIGDALLNYDLATGRYSDGQNEEEAGRWYT